MLPVAERNLASGRLDFNKTLSHLEKMMTDFETTYLIGLPWPKKFPEIEHLIKNLCAIVNPESWEKIV